MNKRYAFVTFIFEGDMTYLNGLFVLAKSLLDTKSKHPLVVVIPDDSSSDFVEMVKNYSLNSEVIKMPNVRVTLNVTDERLKYWERTVFRFNVARMTQFKKVVMIDNDMLVLTNVDELFNYPHLSGSPCGNIKYPEWDMPNGGLLVFEPSQEYYNELIDSVEKVRLLKNNNFNDQDVFHYTMKNWTEKKELYIPENYNEYYRWVGLLVKTLPNGWKDMKIIHYFGYEKPWHFTKKTYFYTYLKNIRYRRFDINKCLSLYIKCLKKMKRYGLSLIRK